MWISPAILPNQSRLSDRFGAGLAAQANLREQVKPDKGGRIHKPGNLVKSVIVE